MSADPPILFVKPGAIQKRDKSALSKAGVIVVEVDDPNAIKFVRAGAEISTTEMLCLAAKALLDGNEADRLGDLIAKVYAGKYNLVPTTQEPPQ